MTKPDRKTLRAFIASIGGDQAVAARLGVTEGAVSYCYDQRAFTASWYSGLCVMAEQADVEPPLVEWFQMKPLKPAAPPEETAGEAA